MPFRCVMQHFEFNTCFKNLFAAGVIILFTMQAIITNSSTFVGNKINYLSSVCTRKMNDKHFRVD